MAFPDSTILQEQVGSPKMRKDDNYLYLERTFQCAVKVDNPELLVAMGYLPEVGYIDPQTGAIYEGYTYDASIAYPVVVVTFKLRLSPLGKYDLHEASYERPIELHPSFKQKWKFGLYSTGTITVPAWADTATNDANIVGQNEYIWATGPTGNYNVLVQQPTKRGIENYLVSTVAVTKNKVYTDDFYKWVGQVGKLNVPYQSFTLTTDNNNWLLRDVRLVEDLNAFSAVIEWLYNPAGWDTDIYSVSTTEDEGL